MAAYGIDVSHWQGAIDWDKVSTGNKEFAIIKASEGTGFVDKRFTSNRANAKRAGLAVGAYHYFRPGWDTQAQAQHWYNVVGTLIVGDMIPWLDVEDFRQYVNGPIIGTGRIVKELAETLVAADKLFGVKVGVYTGSWFWDQLPISWEMDRPLWVATWNDNGQPGRPVLPNGWSDYAIHQYSARGSVPGVNGPCDLNYIPGDLEALRIKPAAADDDEAKVREHLTAIMAHVAGIQALIGETKK